MNIFGTIVYVGVGFLVHLIFVGSVMNWASTFTFFVIALWPFYLIYLFMWIVMWIAIVCIVVFLIFCACSFIKNLF